MGILIYFLLSSLYLVGPFEITHNALKILESEGDNPKRP